MFDSLKALPADPILGLIAACKDDPNPEKIDLGVGVFRTSDGLTPVLESVKEAEQWLLQNEETKAYIGPAGNPGFNQQMLELCLGKDHSAIRDKRCVMLQTPGGCGALRVGAELILRSKPGSRIWVSDPTWANHIPLLGDAGIEIVTYPYYDSQNHEIAFDQMMAALENANADDFVLLHACCHNPCGADLSRSQWQSLVALAEKRGFTPFVDMAYQGFANGVDEDAYGLRLIAESLPEMLFAVSCSKNFGLYRERVGAVGVLAKQAEQVPAIASHVMSIVRGIYSMPPSHGAAIVEHVLANDLLRSAWESELKVMRDRIREMRTAVVQRSNQAGAGGRFDFIAHEQGMFSFLGLSVEQVDKLAAEHSIYMVNSSRINIAGLNQGNISRFCEALTVVVG